MTGFVEWVRTLGYHRVGIFCAFYSSTTVCWYDLLSNLNLPWLGLNTFRLCGIGTQISECKDRFWYVIDSNIYSVIPDLNTSQVKELKKILLCNTRIWGRIITSYLRSLIDYCMLKFGFWLDITYRLKSLDNEHNSQLYTFQTFWTKERWKHIQKYQRKHLAMLS